MFIINDNLSLLGRATGRGEPESGDSRIQLPNTIIPITELPVLHLFPGQNVGATVSRSVSIINSIQVIAGASQNATVITMVAGIWSVSIVAELDFNFSNTNRQALDAQILMRQTGGLDSFIFTSAATTGNRIVVLPTRVWAFERDTALFMSVAGNIATQNSMLSLSIQANHVI